MAELEGSGGGAIGGLWRKHGGGYYALMAVGTFVYMEIQSVIEAVGDATGVRDFVESQIFETLLTLGFETLINTFLSGIWPFMWAGWMGLQSTLLWAGGGYVAWSVVVAWLLARRETEYRKELGL